MGLDDMAPNDLANLMTVGGAALCSLLMVVFKSRCTQISVLWGLWKCDRTMSNEFDEETATNENDNYYLEVEYFALIISYRLATIDILLVGVSRD